MQKKAYHNPSKKSKSNSTCFSCGASSARTFEQIITGGHLPDGVDKLTAYRATPTRPAQVEADVLVPAGQSLISAIVIVLPAIAISFWLRWEWYSPLAVGSVAIAVSWFRAMADVKSNSILVEEVSYSLTDAEAPPRVPDRQGGPLKLEIVHEQSDVRSRMQLMEIGGYVDEENFGKFLKDILAGKSSRRRDWTGGGKPFSRDDYDEIIEKLQAAEVLEDAKNGSRVLSANGKRTVKAMVRGGVI